jgi:hypothetical protein
VDLWWQVFQQERHGFVQLRRTDEVVVVEHHDKLTGEIGEVVEHRRHHRLQRLGRPQQR